MGTFSIKSGKDNFPVMKIKTIPIATRINADGKCLFLINNKMIVIDINPRIQFWNNSKIEVQPRINAKPS